MKEVDQGRREFLKKATYLVPVVFTATVAPTFAIGAYDGGGGGQNSGGGGNKGDFWSWTQFLR